MALNILVIELETFKILHLHCSILTIKVFFEDLKKCFFIVVINLGLNRFIHKNSFLNLVD